MEKGRYSHLKIGDLFGVNLYRTKNINIDLGYHLNIPKGNPNSKLELYFGIRHECLSIQYLENGDLLMHSKIIDFM